jgi:uncharacterized protein
MAHSILLALLVCLPVGRATPRPEIKTPPLLSAATRVAQLGADDSGWGPYWLSSSQLLILRSPNVWTNQFFCRDLRTGVETPLKRLTDLYRHANGYGMEVSPDGRWLLWKNGQQEAHWARIDGSRHISVRSDIGNRMHWTRDSRNWVEFEARGGFDFPSVRIFETGSRVPALVDTSKGSPLTREDYCYPPVDINEAAFTTKGTLLTSRTRGTVGGVTADILEVDLKQGGRPVNQYAVHLPWTLALAEHAFSPDGRHVAWLLWQGSTLLVVTRMDGSDVRILGELPTTPVDLADPDSRFVEEPRRLSWTPDGMRLSFLHESSLYVIQPFSGGVRTMGYPFVTTEKAGNSPGRELQMATFKNDVQAIGTLLSQGVSPNVRDDYGYTPLMIAAKEGYAEAVSTLLNAGADPNVRDRRGRTPLMAAIENGHNSIALLLLSRGARPNAQWEYGYTALIPAAGSGAVSVVNALLERGANPNIEAYEGGTPLMAAASAGSLPVVELLLSAGAKVDARDKRGTTALFHAAARDHLTVCKALLAHGADPNVQAKNVQPMRILTNGETALILAASNGNVELCRLLVQASARINATDHAGYSALAMAVNHRHAPVVHLLLESGANPNLDHINSTTLIGAVLSKHTGIVADLLAHGAHVNALGEYYGSGNSERKTPLAWARHKGTEEIVRILEAAGAK